MKPLTPSPGSPVKIILAMAFVVGCWGYSPTGIHIGLQAYDPGIWRCCGFCWPRYSWRWSPCSAASACRTLRDLPLLFALGFFAVSLHHVALNFGQQGVSAGASSVLAQSTPLFSTLLARFVFKDRVSAWRWGCVVPGIDRRGDCGGRRSRTGQHRRPWLADSAGGGFLEFLLCLAEASFRGATTG